MNEWRDKYGFIKSKSYQDSTGNPYLYTVIYSILNRGENFYLNQLWKKELGVLWRTPDNTYGQNSHDEYLALAVDHIMIPCTEVPRQVIWSCIKKLGFMRNDFKEKNGLWKSWLLRFPHVWIVMIAAAFPNRIVFLVNSKLLQLLMSFSNPQVKDASGMQLTFMNLYAIHLMGNSKPLINFMKRYNMSEIMSGYYEIGHPILEGYKNFRV